MAQIVFYVYSQGGRVDETLVHHVAAQMAFTYLGARESDPDL